MDSDISEILIFIAGGLLGSSFVIAYAVIRPKEILNDLAIALFLGISFEVSIILYTVTTSPDLEFIGFLTFITFPIVLGTNYLMLKVLRRKK